MRVEANDNMLRADADQGHTQCFLTLLCHLDVFEKRNQSAKEAPTVFLQPARGQNITANTLAKGSCNYVR